MPQPIGESVPTRRHTLLKTLSWRVVASATTFLIAWFVTGDLTAGAAIGGVEVVAKVILYYWHERAWQTYAPIVRLTSTNATS